MLSRFGQGLTATPSQFITWPIVEKPEGASPGFFEGAGSTGVVGERGILYTLGDKQGDYIVGATCDICQNNSGTVVPFTTTAEEGTLKLEKVTTESLSGSAGEALKPLLVKVTDEEGDGKSGVNVNYTIISQPTGSVSSTEGSISKTTSGDGTASATLTLGDKVGPYIIQVTCDDCNTGSPLTFTANVVGPEGCSGNGASIASQVNFASSNLFYTKNLFSLAGTGPQVGFTLAFNSLDVTESPVGLHWTHTYDMQITRDSGGFITLKEEGGKRIVFSESTTNLFIPIDHFSRSGTILEKFGDGSYQLTRRDATRYLFDSAGKLTEIFDQNNNSLTLVYTSGELTTLTDEAGRVTSLAYDG